MTNKYQTIKRKQNTRKKILIGDYVLYSLKKVGYCHIENQKILKKDMSTFLTREQDLKLFEIEKNEETTEN